MRIIVTSDVHRRTNYLLEIIEKHYDNTDLFINLGDSENEVDEALMLYPKLKIERVCGNCDMYSALPDSRLITANGKKLFFCHGHRFYVKHGYQMIEEHAKSVEADICLFGHTHIPYIEKKDGVHYMNPGAVHDGIYGVIDIEPSGIMMYHNRI